MTTPKQWIQREFGPAWPILILWFVIYPLWLLFPNLGRWASLVFDFLVFLERYIFTTF